jgi:hypothetical protein
MRIIHSKHFPQSYCLNFFGMLLVRDKVLMLRYAQFLYINPYDSPQEARYAWGKLHKTQEVLRMIIGEDTLNEERIHTEQMRWLLFLPYYLFYIIFFLIYLLKTMNFNRAYELNPFEREAKVNRKNKDYCQTRDKYGWLFYF